MRTRRSRTRDADLDITSFMNLMIILVPVLLMGMVFSQVTILNLALPDLSDDAVTASEMENEILELVIEKDQLLVNFPAGQRVKAVPLTETGVHDFARLSDVLQEIKQRFQKNGIDKRAILILSQPETDYQTLVAAMDTARSFTAVQAASTVQAELFPDISLGDAPADSVTSENEEKG